MILVVYAHPAPLDNKKSHNARVLREIIAWSKTSNEKIRIIDLYRDNFDPNLSIEEWERSEPLDAALIQKYQQWIKESSGIVFVYPIWWYNYPAIMKGFVDRVFTSGFAFKFKKDGNIQSNGLIEWIASISLLYPIFKNAMPIEKLLKGKKALVINTFDGPRVGAKLFKNPQRKSMDQSVLEFSGFEVRNVEWFEARKSENIPKEIWAKIESELKELAKK